MMKKGYTYIPSEQRIKYKKKMQEEKYKNMALKSTPKTAASNQSVNPNIIPSEETVLESTTEQTKKEKLSKKVTQPSFKDYRRKILEKKKMDKKKSKQKKKEIISLK